MKKNVFTKSIQLLIVTLILLAVFLPKEYAQTGMANLGYFEDMNLAILVRKRAEKTIRNGTFEDFFYEMRDYHLGEKNSKQLKKH